jgi:hypothetical protein
MLGRDYNGPPWEDDPKKYDIPQDFLASKEIKEARKLICSRCENLNKFNICSECWCVMPAKWWINVATCPINKW